MGAKLGNLEWAYLLGTLRNAERDSGDEASLSLSLWELCEENLEGGLPCWGPWRIGRNGSGDGRLFP
jgi:hypothetical protein